MSNPQNLIPFNVMSPKKRSEISAMGGRATKGIFMLKKNRKCKPKCPLFDRCIYAPLSKNYNGRCALANIDIQERTKKRYLKLLRGTENDFISNLKDLLAEVDILARKERDFNTLRKLIYDYINVFKTIFGIKLKQDIQTQQNITIEDIKKELKKLVEEDKNG